MFQAPLFKHIEIMENKDRIGGSFRAQLARKIAADPEIPSLLDVQQALASEIGLIQGGITPWFQYMKQKGVVFRFVDGVFLITAKDYRTARLISSALLMVTVTEDTPMPPLKSTVFIHSQREAVQNSRAKYRGLTLVGLNGFLLVSAGSQKLDAYLPDFDTNEGVDGWATHLRYVDSGTPGRNGIYITVNATGDVTTLNNNTQETTVVKWNQQTYGHAVEISPPPVTGPSGVSSQPATTTSPKKDTKAVEKDSAVTANPAPSKPKTEDEYTVILCKTIYNKFVVKQQCDFGSVVIPEPVSVW
jgi:hypothetical protein